MKYFERIIRDFNVGQEGSVCLGGPTHAHKDAGWEKEKLLLWESLN
jgi:hypothetical protein